VVLITIRHFIGECAYVSQCFVRAGGVSSMIEQHGRRRPAVAIKSAIFGLPGRPRRRWRLFLVWYFRAHTVVQSRAFFKLLCVLAGLQFLSYPFVM